MSSFTTPKNILTKSLLWTHIAMTELKDATPPSLSVHSEQHFLFNHHSAMASHKLQGSTSRELPPHKCYDSALASPSSSLYDANFITSFKNLQEMLYLNLLVS